MKRSAFVTVAAAIPCAALLLFAAFFAHEAWLIATHQIAIVPRPAPGQATVPELPARSLWLPVLGSAAFGACFGYAAWRSSARALLAAYGLLLALAAAIVVRHLA